MATVYERKLKSGNTTWRVQIRRKGLPYFQKAFLFESDAREWVEKNEELFIEHPDKYIASQDNLSDAREREFARKKEKGNERRIQAKRKRAIA